MASILITGAIGFIGSAMCDYLSSYGVIGIDVRGGPLRNRKISWEEVDLTDPVSVAKIFKKYSPDVVIHCAGIAHQKIGTIDAKEYFRVNSEATENLLKVATAANPDLHFIFLSTISVYGENISDKPVSEDRVCSPSSDYALSKLDAEKRLIRLYEAGLCSKLTILRLAPVYDREWSSSLERRVFAPKKIVFFKVGAGKQKMSALARPNLVEFIAQLLKRSTINTGIEIMNVCDAEPYEFNKIINVFKTSELFSDCPTIRIPLPIIWLSTRMAGVFARNKKKWIHSFYDKLASSLVFDNSKMLQIGFKPRHTLETIFLKKC
jgi:nucleoside-diphosphate-sugar epimerase